MGAYQIWHVEFKNREVRDKFEAAMKKRRLFQYHEFKDEPYDCTYYVGWEGYYYAKDFLKSNSNLRNGIIKFETLDLSTQGEWYNELD